MAYINSHPHIIYILYYCIMEFGYKQLQVVYGI